MKLIFSNSQSGNFSSAEKTSKSDESISPKFQLHFISYRVVGAQVMQMEAAAQFQMGVDAEQQRLNIKGEVLAVKFTYGRVAGEFQIKGLTEQGLEALNVDISDDLIRITASHDKNVKTCIVTCGDGTQGSPCVTCKSNDGKPFQVCC